MPTEYTLEIAGTEYPWVDLRYVRDYKFYGKLIEATIPEWVAAIAGDDTIVIKRDGETVTSGTVKLIAPFEGVGKGMGMVVTGYTKEMKHATLLVNALTYNADPHDIIIDDIGSSDLTDGTTDVYGANIVVEFGSNDESKFNRKMAYGEVAFITGWELYTNPTGALDFKSQCGVDRGQTPAGTTVAFKHGELLESWYKPHMLNHLVKKTKVIVIGAFESSFELYGITGVGDNVYTIERKNLIDNNTCELASAAVYADMQNTLKVGVMNVIDTYVGAAYDVYDTIYAVDARFGLDEDVRIYRIERHIDKNGEHTKIFYTNITKLTCNGPLLLNLGDQHLATGQRVLRDFGRSPQSVFGEGGSGPRIEFKKTGIYGIDNADANQFYVLVADGKAYFAGGKAIIDSNGLTFNDTTGYVITFKDDAGAVTLGHLLTIADQIRLISNAGAYVGLDTPTSGDLTLEGTQEVIIVSGNGKVISLKPDTETVSYADIDPSADITKSLGLVGKAWRYFAPRTNLAGRPAASVTTVGLVWCTREGAGTLERYWVCIQNVANNYEWLELGIVNDHGAGSHTNVTREKFYPALNDSAANSTLKRNIIELAANQLGEVSWTFKVPDKFVSFTSLKLVFANFGGGDDMYWTLRVNYFAEGEIWSTHVDYPAYGVTTSTGGNIIDVQEPLNGLTLTNLALGDYLRVYLLRDGTDPLDHLNVVDIYGILFTYVGEQ